MRRLLFHLAASRAVGTWGYYHYEHLPWEQLVTCEPAVVTKLGMRSTTSELVLLARRISDRIGE